MTDPSASGHLDLDALADVLAGERRDDRHLRGCPACTERLAELAEAEVGVVASLATLPAPALPDGLSERLAGALRAEAARAGSSDSASPRSASPRSTSPHSTSPHSTPSHGGGASVTPLTRRRRRTPTWLPAAAAGVALVLAGGFALNAVSRTGSEDASTDTAAGGAGGAESEAASSDSAQVESLAALGASSGTDYAVEVERATALPRLLADAQTLTSTGPQPAAPQPGAPAASPLPAPAAADRAADPSLERLRDPAALAECLAAAERDGSPPTAPLSLDYAAYDGAPALAVVQPSGDAAVLVLTVVGPGCSGADPVVLLRTRLPRP